MIILDIPHRLSLQSDQNNRSFMFLVLTNAVTVAGWVRGKGQIEEKWFLLSPCLLTECIRSIIFIFQMIKAINKGRLG